MSFNTGTIRPLTAKVKSQWTVSQVSVVLLSSSHTFWHTTTYLWDFLSRMDETESSTGFFQSLPE